MVAGASGLADGDSDMNASAQEAGEFASTGFRPKVLYLSRNYPNAAMPRLGLWVEGLVRHARGKWDAQVVAPVPYCPPLPFLSENYTRFRKVPGNSRTVDIPVVHPRIPTPPGGRMRMLEGNLCLASIASSVGRLRRDFPFDLIHAHFTYPDGWVAAKLGERYGVPVVITEHASWQAWSSREPKILARARWAMEHCAAHVSVGSALREEMSETAAGTGNFVRIPNGIDDTVFTLPSADVEKKRDQVLFVGAIRPVKGLDILLHAFAAMVREGRVERLFVVGEVFFAAYRKAYAEARALAHELGLEDRVTFCGGVDHAEVARLMQESAVLVAPSRRETLGMVLVEALACGTPVVATACGGPSDIVTPDVGKLVPVEDADALARAITSVLDHPEDYPPERLRAHAVRKFAWSKVAEDYLALYRHILQPDGGTVSNTGH